MVGSNLGVGKFVIWKVEERERERERERMRSREDGEVGEVGEVKGAGKRGGEDSGFWICSPRQHSLNGFLSKKIFIFSIFNYSVPSKSTFQDGFPKCICRNVCWKNKLSLGGIYFFKI